MTAETHKPTRSPAFDEPGALTSPAGPNLTRFQAYETRDFRSELSLRIREVVQHAKYRRHGKAGVSWRDVPLLKDPWDMALYPMLLWELRPATIIELGSYLGGSALWLADLASIFGIQARIVSIEREVDQIRVDDPRIEFVEADLNRIAEGLPVPLEEMTHPWLVIEDAHENLISVLAHMDRYVKSGDYMIVEDTAFKRKYEKFEQFMLQYGSRYKVDTYYADNFGYNGTWCWNSILKCVADAAI